MHFLLNTKITSVSKKAEPLAHADAAIHVLTADDIRRSGATSIPEALRPLIGNRVYGCDDCQLICPWNKFAQTTQENDFAVREGLDQAQLTTLFAWSQEEFEHKLAGSAIRRIGYEQWLRNLAVGLGNAASSAAVISALQARLDHPSALVREHVRWALQRHKPPTRL